MSCVFFFLTSRIKSSFTEISVDDKCQGFHILARDEFFWSLVLCMCKSLLLCSIIQARDLATCCAQLPRELDQLAFIQHAVLRWCCTALVLHCSWCCAAPYCAALVLCCTLQCCTATVLHPTVLYCYCVARYTAVLLLCCTPKCCTANVLHATVLYCCMQ